MPKSNVYETLSIEGNPFPEKYQTLRSYSVYISPTIGRHH